MKFTYLLDTNTFSYIVKGTSLKARAQFQRLSADPDSTLCISSITEAELRYGMARYSLSPQRRSAVEALLAYVEILPLGSEEAAAYGTLRANLESRGISLGALDMLIAAHAMAAAAVLVTTDRAFANVSGLRRENWATDL